MVIILRKVSEEEQAKLDKIKKLFGVTKNATAIRRFLKHGEINR